MSKLTYATTTSYYPEDGGRTIALPEGCTSVLYVFDDRELAEEMSQGGIPVELRRTGTSTVEIAVDLDTGKVQKQRGWF